jgi:hypothetical protein
VTTHSELFDLGQTALSAISRAPQRITYRARRVDEPARRVEQDAPVRPVLGHDLAQPSERNPSVSASISPANWPATNRAASSGSGP